MDDATIKRIKKLEKAIEELSQIALKASGDLKSNLILLQLIPENGETAGANNVYWAAAIQIHGTNAYDSGTYNRSPFKLPSHYVAGANFKIHVCVQHLGAGAQTIKYKAELRRHANNLTSSTKQTWDSTWNVTGSTFSYQEITCTTTGTFTAGDVGAFLLTMSDNAEASNVQLRGLWLELL